MDGAATAVMVNGSEFEAGPLVFVMLTWAVAAVVSKDAGIVVVSRAALTNCAGRL